MATVQSNIIFGVPPVRPLRGFPPGQVRIRLRAKEYARVFVRDGGGIRAFTVKLDADGWWTPHIETATNFRP